MNSTEEKGFYTENRSHTCHTWYVFNRKVKCQLPQLIKTRVINKHKFAKENIDARKQGNKDYQDKKRAAKEANIHDGDILVYKQKKINKTTPLFSPESVRCS